MFNKRLIHFLLWVPVSRPGVSLFLLALTILLTLSLACQKQAQAPPRTYAVTGVIEELKPDGTTAVIKHQAIPNYMAAMTMPFTVKQPSELAGLQTGDEITFRLNVTEEASWIDQVLKTGKRSPTSVRLTPATNAVTTFKITDIPNFALTNEHGQAVSLRQFQGQAVALTFLFTRCPIPEYCPRLANNFEAASAQLKAMPHAPTNWHLLCISFDPLDTPPVLKAFGQRYNYDSNHWSFLTGDPNHIRELTRGFGLAVTNDGYFYTHDFRTAVFDASGRLRVMWPMGGDTSGILVQELLKAMAVKPLSSVETVKR